MATALLSVAQFRSQRPRGHAGGGEVQQQKARPFDIVPVAFQCGLVRLWCTNHSELYYYYYCYLLTTTNSSLKCNFPQSFHSRFHAPACTEKMPARSLTIYYCVEKEEAVKQPQTLASSCIPINSLVIYFMVSNCGFRTVLDADFRLSSYE